jgi:2-polyprenyl-3-methyl-5-hydroxy-6-metoxy-1,4-benzoquinol methylase
MRFRRLRALATLAQWPTLFLVKTEVANQRFKRHNERAVEFAFLFRCLAQLAPKTVLDVGTGNTSVPHMIRNCGPVVTALDNVSDYWPRGMVNRHWHVVDDDIRHPKIKGPFDMVTCISVLEHIVPADDAVASMLRLLRPGGDLVLTMPFHAPDYVADVYKLPTSASRTSRNAYVAQSYGTADLTRWLAHSNAEVVEQEYWRYWTGTYWTEGQQIIPPERSTADQPHQHTCLLIRKR